ncbi:MAG: hypothetical protein HKN67_02700 [Saprospiraceae bacterium]|nr:hypothetical protein [Saprospiraceae bacterium]
MIKRTIISTTIFLFLMTCVSSCKKCEDFKDVCVDFYTTHPSLVLKEAVFEKRTELKLVREAHLSLGAKFETVTEQVLVYDNYTKYEIQDSTMIYLVVNSETDSIGVVQCYNFIDESQVNGIEIPRQYKSRNYQRVVDPGTGIEVPATYDSIVWYKRVEDSELKPVEGLPRQFETLCFRIPEEMTIRDYLLNQLATQQAEDCIETGSYRIRE